MTALHAEVWQRAGDWVLDRWSRRQDWSAGHRCLLFVAAEICRRQIAREDLARLDSGLLTPAGELTTAAREADPYALLMALGRLVERGCARAPFAAYLREVGEALTRLTAAGPPRGQVLLLSALLAEAREGKGADPWDGDGPPLLRPEELFDAGDEAVEELCHALAARTGFGARPEVLAPGNRTELAEALAAVALSYLRDYRLDTACQVLRALLYLDPGNPAARQAATYLRLQQQACGCFGFLSHTGKGLLASRGADVDAEVLLPTTFACLWTLALVETGRDPIVTGAERNREGPP